MRLARALGAIGRTLITAGVLILLFVTYQLWGTGIREAQAQNHLEDEFAAQLQAAATSTTTDGTSSASSTTTTTEPPGPPPEGEGVAHIVIPKIGVDKIVVEGVRLTDLKDGPGHYPDSPLPGNPGNAAIAGHRTTYGAPFNRIDELATGDEILVTTLQGEFRYEVTEQLIVRPSQVEVLEDKGDNRLTLTACHPKYSARQRIVVTAKLVQDPAPAPPTTATPPDDEPVPAAELRLDLDGEGASAWPAIGWGLAAAFAWFAAWAIGRRWRKWPSYAMGLPFFLVVLFLFFENFSRLLPSNF